MIYSNISQKCQQRKDWLSSKSQRMLRASLVNISQSLNSSFKLTFDNSILEYMLYTVVIVTPQYIFSSSPTFANPLSFALTSRHPTLMTLFSILLLVCIQVVSVAVCSIEDSISLLSSFSFP